MEKIIAILPLMIKGKGICSQIYYEDGLVDDYRTCSNFLKRLCDRKNVSVRMMRKNIKKYCKVKRNIPWAIDENNVFIGFKCIDSDQIELRREYVNCKYVDEVVGSDFILTTGEKISSIQSQESLNSNLLLGFYLMYRMKYEALMDLFESDRIIRKIAKVKM